MRKIHIPVLLKLLSGSILTRTNLLISIQKRLKQSQVRLECSYSHVQKQKRGLSIIIFVRFVSHVASAGYFMWHVWAHSCDDVDGMGKFQPMGSLLSYTFRQPELSSSNRSVVWVSTVTWVFSIPGEHPAWTTSISLSNMPPSKSFGI